MTAGKNRGLGKGLEALFGEIEISPPGTIEELEEGETSSENGIRHIDIHRIKPNASQPRQRFNEESIAELASSIKEHGVIQPILLKKAGSGYEIIAGERRWRAARKAGLSRIPCLIRELTDEQSMLLAIIENVQREDLNPLEEAEALQQMIHRFGLTQEQVSKSVGKSRPYVTNALRLLKLPEQIRQLVLEEKLTNGHARALLSIEDSSKQLFLAVKAVEEGLSVREVERLAGQASGKAKAAKKKQKDNPEIQAVERDLKEALGTKVTLKQIGKKGRIMIDYFSREELERLIDLLKSLK